MSDEPDAHAAAGQVNRLLDQLRSGPDPRAALVAEELVRCLVRLYGAGLERIMATVGADHGRDLAADPLVESLLLVHDLHPLDVDARIRRALDRIPAGSASGTAEYLGIDGDGVVRVRMTGGRGCADRSLRQAITTAVRDAAPETTGVEFDVAAAPPVLLQISRRPAGLVDAGP
ncbi:NifU family protein [Virgisporangium aurantiacum]|uniref:Thioredoxin n=1 Tax=Virgisporangium aurantiacum TaxID=175570 RepID=A0A8J3YZF4_9ACTN|nr:NifU family protein [Virgisporangium aurantiacum]GIJ54844.1 thioredoxin [Virgisporangium aurantiacum]